MAKPQSKAQRQPRIADLNEEGNVQLNLDEGARAQAPKERRPESSAFGSDLSALQVRFADDVISSLWVPESASQEDTASIIDAALLMFARLDPRDEAEAMLCVQMVATHNAAIECQRRAMYPGQSFQGRDMALKHAAKMSALYEKQLAAYDKRRGKRNQTVVVKHVTVEPGAQAIVGDVHTHSGSDAASSSKPAGALEHRSEDALSLETETQKVPLQKDEE